MSNDRYPVRQHWRAGLILSVLAALAAVAVGNASPLAEQAVPAFTPAEPLGEVVTALPGTSEVLDLEACLAQALASNDSLSAERERQDELRGQRYQALATGLPSFDLVSDWSRRRDPSFALDPTFGGGEGGLFPEPVGADPWFNDWLGGFGSFIPAAQDIQAVSYWSTKVTLNWELNPRKILGAVGAADLGIERQDLLIEAAEHATLARTIDAYHAVVMMAEAVQAVEARHANLRELMDLTKLRFELGLATRLDTLQAAVNLANVDPELRSYRRRVRNAGARLNAVMGKDPTTPLAIANQSHLEVDTIDREQALAMASSRPDLTAGDRLVGMLERQGQTQGAERWWPAVSLYGAYGWIGTDFDQQWDEGHENWLVSAAVTVPLWNGLLTTGQVHQTKAQIRRSHAELRGMRRGAQVTVLEVLNNLETSRRNLDAARLNLERAAEALSESLLMYELGQASYLDVLGAESGHLTARLALIEARYQVLSLTAVLKQAVGHSPALPLTDIAGLVAASGSQGVNHVPHE